MAKPPPAFARLEGLLDHRGREGFDIRPTLLRVLTDLYLQKPAHPPDDERYYTELALRLINSTDLAARTAVAERLASYPAAPHQVIMRLARDVIDVAAPILKHSPCLTAADLELIAADCGPAHAAMIAARSPGLDGKPQITGAGEDRGTAEAAELSELFFSANSAERRLILLNLDYAPQTPFALAPIRAGAVAGRLEAAALAHNIEAFIREIELGLGIASALARRIATDELGEPIVAITKALWARRAVLERILLFVNPSIGQSVQRVHELADHYDGISAEAAQRLVAIWRIAEPLGQAPPAPPRSMHYSPSPERGKLRAAASLTRPPVRESAVRRDLRSR
jgi:hypothetical protein